MRLISVTKVSENPKEDLLELFATDNDPFIVMMSNDWFEALKKCDGVRQDLYELNPPGYYAYFIEEKSRIDSKILMKIEVEFIGGTVVITNSDKIRKNYYATAEKIYYFQYFSSPI